VGIAGGAAFDCVGGRGIHCLGVDCRYLRIGQGLHAKGQRVGWVDCIGLILLHVATPVEECEKRDRKGMYAKARAGLVTGFTGADAPYETPVNPEVAVHTTNITPEKAAQEVMLAGCLREKYPAMHPLYGVKAG